MASDSFVANPDYAFLGWHPALVTPVPSIHALINEHGNAIATLGGHNQPSVLRTLHRPVQHLAADVVHKGTCMCIVGKCNARYVYDYVAAELLAGTRVQFQYPFWYKGNIKQSLQSQHSM